MKGVKQTAEKDVTDATFVKAKENMCTSLHFIEVYRKGCELMVI